MFNVYLYVMDTMADWEVGHITTELNSKRFFKKDAPESFYPKYGYGCFSGAFFTHPISYE